MTLFHFLKSITLNGKCLLSHGPPGRKTIHQIEEKNKLNKDDQT